MALRLQSVHNLLCSVLVAGQWSISLQEHGDHCSVLISSFLLRTPVFAGVLSSLGLLSPDSVPKVEFSDNGGGWRGIEECGDASEKTRSLSAGGHQCQKVWSLPRNGWGQIWV